MIDFLFHKFIEWMESLKISNYISTAIFSVLPFSIIMFFLVTIVIFLVLIERKLLGYFQQRKGPNRVGLWGILQTFADAIKLMCKENIDIANADKILFNLSPIVSFVSVILLWCIIPYNSDFRIINSSVSLLLYLFISSFPMVFHFLGGYSSCNRYSMIAAFRALYLSVAYSIPFIFILLSIICLTGSMDLNSIIEYQSKYWIIFLNIVGFFIFFIACLAKLNRTPFDLPEAESELVCGYHTEYSGMKFAMFFLAEYAELFVMSSLIVILFLGGYMSPFGYYVSNIVAGNSQFYNYLLYFEQTIWLFIKTFIMIFLIIWTRATLPRLTQTQTLKLFWKYLTPISIVNLIVILVLKTGLYDVF